MSRGIIGYVRFLLCAVQGIPPVKYPGVACGVPGCIFESDRCACLNGSYRRGKESDGLGGIIKTLRIAATGNHQHSSQYNIGYLFHSFLRLSIFQGHCLPDKSVLVEPV